METTPKTTAFLVILSMVVRKYMRYRIAGGYGLSAGVGETVLDMFSRCDEESILIYDVATQLKSNCFSLENK